ncbi:riboflavin biosynthesis protein RibF [Neorickettsia helminthoeca str. Oregon]|uniref:Riboflavin biosynthesis protein n=1 Tax=Neorickettsia helminthoeca str. Oregon TaxID=1286528 RepID=X5HL10_9RICK|nr:riboflavin biosynthesis protein RibF [Neorickettsia helminthoeca]AHX11015.1 riboflavin biosynthesis protein RibF [Neorickettsia helminthoeca str. Oregon]
MEVYSVLQRIQYPSVVTFGNFDGVHLGHAALFSVVCDLARVHSLHRVIITFDPHPSCYLEGKDDFLILDKMSKIELLAPYTDSLYFIRFDQSFSKLSPRDFLALLSSYIDIKYLVNAENCRFGNGGSGSIQDVRDYQETFSYKSVVLEVESNGGAKYSSTLIRNAIKNGDLTGARQFLGRFHSIRGVIEKGRGLAATIGFPTINISIPDEIIKPKLGVYLAEVVLGPEVHQGIVNIGKRPTTCSSGKVILEMHIFDFAAEVYGEIARVYLKSFLREERQFDSLAQLKEQISRDIGAALSNNFLS